MENKTNYEDRELITPKEAYKKVKFVLWIILVAFSLFPYWVEISPIYF